MKIITPDQPLELNGKSYMTLQFEIGDMFIDKDNKIICLSEIVDHKPKFIDAHKKTFVTIPAFDKDFQEKYRFAGTIEDENLFDFGNALPLKY